MQEQFEFKAVFCLKAKNGFKFDYSRILFELYIRPYFRGNSLDGK